jgi:hypothetical protein
MPRKPINYSKCKFYRLVCKDVTVKECYVGHTTDEKNRRKCHKSRCTNEKGSAYTFFVYRFIREHGGWDNWYLLVHETLSVENKVAAALRERYWFEFYGATLNRTVPGRTDAEYTHDHRDVLNQRSAAWDAAHEEYLKKTHTCDCGGKYTTRGRCRHIKTNRHCTYIAAQPAI